MKLFVDTGAWYALYNDVDDYHHQALAFLQELVGQKSWLFTSDYVFDETVTLLRARLGHKKAVDFGQWIRQSELVRMLDVDQKVREATWEMFVRYRDKDFSFTDCTSFVLMRQLRLTDAFALDDHFEQMGFVMWPRTD